MNKDLKDALQSAGGALVDYFAQGYTLGPLLGNSQEAQEAAYTVAYRLYKQAKYEPAEHLFVFLMLNDHMDRRYYLGYAACSQMRGEYERALRYYSMAHLFDKADPRPPMHMSECCMALGELERAKTLLTYALIQARYHAEHHALVPRLEALMASLDRARKPAPNGPAEPTSPNAPAGASPESTN